MLSLVIILTAVSSALAVPSAIPRQTTTQCDLNVGGVFESGGPYTVAAFNWTSFEGPSVQLVLSPAIGEDTDSNLRSLATVDSYPNYDYSSFSLDNGEFLANGGGPSGAAAVFTHNGGPLNFDVGSANPDTSYCGQAGTSMVGDDTPVLTVYNDEYNFSLCQATSSGYDSPLSVVIYKPDSDNNGLYDYDSCYSIAIKLLLN